MNKKLVQALNEQVIFEFNSAYAYLALSLAMSEAKLTGFSNWLRFQYQEEMEHAHKFITFLQDRDQVVTLGDIKASATKVTSPLEAAKAILAHEEMISSKINELYALALEEKDFATVNFLAWFINEQVEEEATARDVVDQFTFAGDSKSSQLFVDSKLGSRQQ